MSKITTISVSAPTNWSASIASRNDGPAINVAICRHCGCMVASTHHQVLAIAMQAHDRFCPLRPEFRPESDATLERRIGPFDRRQRRA